MARACWDGLLSPILQALAQEWVEIAIDPKRHWAWDDGHRQIETQICCAIRIVAKAAWVDLCVAVLGDCHPLRVEEPCEEEEVC